MKELTVENMFTTDHADVVAYVDSGTLGPSDRKRMLEHVVAQVVEKVFHTSGSTPIGLSVTITMEKLPGIEQPVAVVRGTAPTLALV